MAWIDFLAAQLWQHVWAVFPLALIAAGACRVSRCAPVTRHGIWVIVLLWFILPPLLPKAPSANWLRGMEANLAPDSAATPEVPKVDPANPRHIPPDTAYDPVSSIIPEPPARTDPSVATKRAPRTAGARTATSAASGRLATGGRATGIGNEPAHLAIPPNSPLGTSHDGLSIDPFELAPDIAAPSRVSNTDGMSPESRPKPPAVRHSAIATRSVGPRNGERADEPAAQPAREPPASTPVAVVAPQPRPWQAWWHSWVTAALVVRSTLARLPSIPAGVWAGGAALVLLWNALGVALFLRRMHGSVRPPAGVAAEVRWVARRLKLRQVPTTRMVNARIPPMLWCGWQPMLVLPVGLWRTLDSVGRCAILCHELAHLRRRDHWVRRLDLLVALLFWWHPVAWWTRRRVQDEADNCCDAWVTWLMPRERRAYAEALLKTRVFIEKTNRATPVLGAAVTTSGAKRLARRVTMVMTQSVRPRPSVSGFVLASVIVVLGWMLTPAVSIAQQVAAVAPAALPATPAVSVVSIASPPPPVDTPDAAVPLFSPPPAPAPAIMGAAPKLTGGRTDERVSRTYRLAPGKLEALADLLARNDVPLKIQRQADAIEVIASQHDQEVFAAFIREIEAQPEAKEWREYPLPAEKLEALYKLMSRQDVPIMVSEEDGVLRAQVTPQQDDILRRFLALIHPEGKAAHAPRASSSKGGRQRSSGATIPTPAPSGYAAPPTPPVLPAVPTPPTPPMPTTRSARPARPEAAARARSEARQAYVKELHAQGRAQRGQSEERAKLLREQAAQVLEQAAELEAQIGELQAQAEHLSQNAAKNADNPAQEKQLEKQLRQLERSTRQLERELERLNDLSDTLEEQADKEESRVDELDSQTEELKAQLEELDDEADEDADDDDESEVRVWGANDAVVLSDLAPAFIDLAATHGGWKRVQNAYPPDAWAGAYTIGTADWPFAVQPQASIALQKAMAGFRATAGDVRTTVRDEVRQSLRAALENAGRTAAIGERDLDRLSDQISALVDAKVAAALEHALAGLELRISVGGLPWHVVSEAGTTDCRAEAGTQHGTGEAQGHAPRP